MLSVWIATAWVSVSPLLAAPPVLVSVLPDNGAVDVSKSELIVFTFDQPMDEETLSPGFGTFAGSINFSPSINLSPSWDSESTVLTMEPNEFLGLFTPNTQYTWTLNPPGAFMTLKSAAGDPLAMRTGNFKIAAGGGGGATNSACSPQDFFSDIDGPAIDTKCYGNGDPGGTNRTQGSLFVSRQQNYRQFLPGAPKPAQPRAPDKPFEFNAFALPEPSVTLTSVTVTPPGKPTIALADAGFGGAFSFLEGFDTLAGMDADYPAGSYRFNVVDNTGSKSGSANMPSSAGNIPEITNLTEAQTIDVSKPFLLRWKPFTVSGTSPSLSLTIQGVCSKKIVFIAPNMCVPIELKPTDTSIVIPGGTLRANRRYLARITFSSGDFSTNTMPGYVLGSSVTAETEFPINDPEAMDPGTGGAPPTMSLSADRTQVLVTATLGQAFSLYGSTDLVMWNKLSSGTGAGGTPVFFPIALPRVHHLYYRATVP